MVLIASLKWGWQAYLNPTVRDICTFAVLFSRPLFDLLVFMKDTLCCVVRRLLKSHGSYATTAF